MFKVRIGGEPRNFRINCIIRTKRVTTSGSPAGHIHSTTVLCDKYSLPIVRMKCKERAWNQPTGICELPSLSAIARTEDERSESEVAAEIGHSQSAERAIARSVTVIALRNPENPSL